MKIRVSLVSETFESLIFARMEHARSSRLSSLLKQVQQTYVETPGLASFNKYAILQETQVRRPRVMAYLVYTSGKVN